MSSFDRINGNYKLDTYNGDIYFTANTGMGSVFINGNLFVIGSFSNIQSVDTYVTDNIITLSANVTGTPVLDAGIEVIRGNLATVGLRWHEPMDRWQITVDGSYWANIMVRVEDDGDPHLGGHLYTTGSFFSNNNWEIRSLSPNNIILNPGWDGNSATTAISIVQSNYTANAVPGVNLLASKTPGPGEAGLYVTNQRTNNSELITKRKALVYSLVL